jgi:hypothetical protein
VQGIIRSYRQAAQLAVARVRELAVDIGGKGLEERKQLLEKCAQTSLNSKLVRGGRMRGDVESSLSSIPRRVNDLQRAESMTCSGQILSACPRHVVRPSVLLAGCRCLASATSLPPWWWTR